MTSRNIYIVDDDDAVRASLHSLLSTRSNLIIRSYKSGDAFLESVGELEPGVAILDYDLPGASGLDVLAALRQKEATIRGIILTGQGNIALAVRAMKAGAHDFLEKPCETGELLAVVDDAFARIDQETAPDQRRVEASTKIERLSGRERDVLSGLISGRSNKAIAIDLDISARTVEVYRANLMEKLEVKSLPEALRIAFAAGLVPLE